MGVVTSGVNPMPGTVQTAISPRCMPLHYGCRQAAKTDNKRGITGEASIST